MKILLLIAFVVVVALFPLVRCIILNPHFVAYYGSLDIISYFKEKRYNNAPVGQLICFCGLFGQGKTLSCVHRVTSLYRRYNDKLVYRNGSFIPNKVFILSNVDLIGIDYIPLVSIQQIVDIAHKCKSDGNRLGFNPIIYVLGDEFSVQMNSRNFKSNIDPLFLNVLLTCRHYNISMFLTSQRFGHMDALLRQVTQEVYQVRKIWRFELMSVFDAWDLENCSNPTLIKPLRSECWFIRNCDFNAYDTLACVGNLEKSVHDGDMLSDEEILSHMSISPDNVDTVSRQSRKLKKRFK